MPCTHLQIWRRASLDRPGVESPATPSPPPRDALKLALALLWERRGECPEAVPVACVHDEILVECHEDQAEKVSAWLEKVMIEGMEEVLNGSEFEGPHVPVEVETQIGKTWAG
jgi:DNA polymerase-1